MYGRGPQQMGFGPPTTPQIIKNLMIANGVVFVFQLMSPMISNIGVVSPAAVWYGWEFWRPFTYMWLHSPGSPFHILFNMFALWMFGSQVALYWGEERFLKYYLTCGVGAGVLIATVPFIPVQMGWSSGADLGIPTLGASGAVMGVILAYAFTWPDRTIMLMFPPMPIKAIWLIPVILVMEFMGPPNVSHVGHLGGILVGWIYLIREGRTPGAPTFNTLLLRYRRYMMRRKIRMVHREDRRDRDRRNRDDGDGPRRFH